METSVKAAKMLVAPETDVASSSSPDTGEAQSEAAATPCVDSSSDFFDPMEEFSRRLEDIVGAYSSAASLLDKQNVMDADLEKMKEEPIEDVKVAMETEVSLIMQSLNNSSSPEEKLEDVVRRYAHLAALRRCDEKKLCVLQQRLSVLLEEKQQLQADRRRSAATCSKLEALCRELQGHYNILSDETLQRCREDEEKREEMTSHFQTMLTEIQAQIEQHSARNDKLCRENTHLTDKLESLMNQCELREESLEKINRHRDLQHKLTEAKLQQANALLAEAEERHKREKEYLLREAIDKTKKCFAMKEQELDMKKKLTLYSQKFDEFQETLAKSNEIYVRFKTEMENMSDKMKKLEKESNLWKTRFENCNKALTDMIEERTEKGKEYDLFVLKIQKLEKLCRALQDERKVLYDKIKEVRHANSSLPAKIFGRSKLSDDSADKSGLLTPLEVQELQDEDTVLTEDMTRLREEQTKLQEFAASLLDSCADNEEDDNNDIDLEEDLVTAAFVQFKTKTEVKKEPVLVPEEQVVEVKAEAAEPDLEPENTEEDQKPDQSTPEEKIFEATPTDPQPKDQVEDKEVQQVRTNEEIKQQQQQQQQQRAEPKPEDPKPEVAVVQTPVEDKKVQQVRTNEEIKQQQQQHPVEQMMTPEAEKVQINLPTDPKPEAAVVQTPVEVQQVRTNEEIKQQQQQHPAEQMMTPEAEKVQINLPTDPKPEAAVVQTPVEDKEVQQVRTNEEIQQQVPTYEAEKAQINPTTNPKPEATEAMIAEETGEVTPAEPVEEEKVQQQATESLQESEEASTQSESAPPSKNTSKTAASSTKQAPKKKKKKSGKNPS